MHLALALLVDGLTEGGILALLATGLVAVFSILRIPNFAQVGTYLAGGYTAYYMYKWTHAPAVLGMWVAALVGGVLGIMLWFVAFRPLMRRPRAEMFVTSFGAFVVIENLILYLFGPSTVIYPVLWTTPGAVLGTIPADQLILVGVATVILLGLSWFYTRTVPGKVLRGVAQNPLAAERSGVNVYAFGLLTLFIGSALGGISGALYGGIGGVSPASGTAELLLVFTILIVGGMGSFRGAVIAAVGLGVLTSVTTYYVSWLTEIINFAAVIVILILRPEGLFGTRGLGTVDVS